MTISSSSPFYENIETRTLVLIVSLVSQGVSLWFITAGILRISSFPPDAFYYLGSLPFTYWWGLTATLALLGTYRLVRGRWRTALEVSSLFLLALYLQGLPSFVYQAPWFLDAYQHEGNSLALLNYNGWLGAPVWYLRQFPGAYTFFAQLTSLAGVDPLLLIKYYAVGLSWLVALFVYVIARMYSPNYPAIASAFLLSGLWFQLHLSPQSLDLIVYLGIIFVLLKIIDDRPRRRAWTLIGLFAIPCLVVSHPTTPLVIILGIVTFLLLSLLGSRRLFLVLLPRVGPFLVASIAWVFFWWFTAASEARIQFQNTILRRAAQGLSYLSITPSNIPTTPAYSYYITTLLDEGVSATVWLLGVLLLLFFKRFRAREYFLAGLFLAAIVTIPIALFAKVDVLQRSYLFALFPVAILATWILERTDMLRFRGRSLHLPLKAGLLLGVIVFSLLMPITRYGVNPFEYVPQSSLFASDKASGLGHNSVLFLHPGEYGWRLYAALRGDIYGVRVEQQYNAFRPGGFTKTNSDPSSGTFNVTFTKADASADYIVVSDYYQNLYLLKFGPQSGYYVGQKVIFEENVSQTFNLVYSTGTDRVYANRDLG